MKLIIKEKKIEIKMEKIKVDGLEFDVITHSDLSEADKLMFLLSVYNTDLLDLLDDNTCPKYNYRKKYLLKQFLLQLPKEKQLLLSTLQKP